MASGSSQCSCQQSDTVRFSGPRMKMRQCGRALLHR